MGKGRGIFRALRIVILLLVLAGTLHLYHWSRSADPRFYLFLRTPTGQMLARVFGWYASPIERVVEDKPEAEMTEREIAVKRALEERIREARPHHKLIMKNGKHMIGRLVEENGTHVTFEESYGDSGSLTVKVKRDRIEKMEELAVELPPITYEDISFNLEFPAMRMYKEPPYTILTDETFFHVQRSVRILQRLHSQFVERFQPLITRPRDGRSIQLVFFSDERFYRKYRKKYAEHMEGTVGFYSPWLDRFILFNEKRSDRMKGITAALNRRAEERGAAAGSEEEAARAQAWSRSAARQLESAAEARTFTTLRHEGSHQLFFTYGVHSPCRIENEWLVEGLAVYCEVKNMGARQATRGKLLKKKVTAGTLIPVGDLVNYRSAIGFLGMEDPDRIELAYSEAWALVRFLLEEERRESFFEYVRYIRDPANLDAILKEPRIDILCRYLKLRPDQLEQRWFEYIKRL